MNNAIHAPSSETTQICAKAPNRRERRRAETRERIIRSALRLFSERGVTSTTVEDITNDADVGKGTFFNYFPTKEDILVHLCQSQMGKIREFVSRSLHSTETMDRVLYNLALILIEEFGHSPALMQSILAAFFSSESARQQLANDVVEDRCLLAELMAARQASGELRGDFSPMELAFQFQRALFGTTVLWSLDSSKPLPDCLQEMANVLWSGIRNQEGNRVEKLGQQDRSW
jgi:AcrR family transcriptional regulator